MVDFAAWLASPAGVAAAVAGAFVIGGMVGSFLNVVAHRVPRGQSVVFGRSRCPACGRTIRAYDNLPVVGWFLLGGRCRDCRAPISARYPLVEAACGTLSAAVAAAELSALPTGAAGTLVAAWAGRTAVALTLVAWASLAGRGHAVSTETMVSAVVAAILAAAVVPALRPLPVGCAALGAPNWPGWATALVPSLVGLAGGWLMGRMAGGSACRACSLVGAALGWQAAVGVGITAAVCRLVGLRDADFWLAAVAVAGFQPLVWAWRVVCRAATGG